MEADVLLGGESWLRVFSTKGWRSSPAISDPESESPTPYSGAVELLSLRFRHKLGPALLSRLEEAAEDCRLPLLDSRLDALDDALDRVRIKPLGVPPVLLLLLFAEVDAVGIDAVGIDAVVAGTVIFDAVGFDGLQSL